MLRAADLFFPNAAEATRIAGVEDPELAAAGLATTGAEGGRRRAGRRRQAGAGGRRRRAGRRAVRVRVAAMPVDAGRHDRRGRLVRRRFPAGLAGRRRPSRQPRAGRRLRSTCRRGRSAGSTASRRSPTRCSATSSTTTSSPATTCRSPPPWRPSRCSSCSATSPPCAGRGSGEPMTTPRNRSLRSHFRRDPGSAADGRASPLTRGLLRVLTGLGLVFIYAPLAFVVLNSFNTSSAPSPPTDRVHHPVVVRRTGAVRGCPLRGRGVPWRWRRSPRWSR